MLPTGCAQGSQGSSDNGNVAGYYFKDNVNTSLSHSASYTYDSLNRLLTAVATGSSAYNLTFAYNQDGSGRYGNMTCTTNGSTNGLCANVTFNASNNRINTAGYGYDAAGDLTNDPTTTPASTYQYDAEGRLAAIVQNGTTYVAYTYDAQGRQVEANFPGFNLKSDSLFGAFGEELGHYNATGGSWWDQDVSAAGRMLAQEETSSVNFLHANALGSDTQVTNQAGTAITDMLYYPWGQVWQISGTEADSHFAGFQQGSGNIYTTPARSYLNGLGRWLTPDPDNAGADPSNPQTWNMYAYAGNNPTTNVDPDGEDYYLLGGDACGTDKVECDKQGYVLGPNGQREIVTDQQVLSGAVGATVGENGVSTITTSQGTFQAQFFDTSPATYEVSGQPGSALAAVGTNFGIGIYNTVADTANSFMTNLTVGQYSMNLPTVPSGSGSAANVGTIAPLLATGLIVPGGEEEVVPNAGQVAQAENVLLTDGRGAVERGIRKFERLLAKHEADLADYQAAGGFTSKTESEIRNFRQLIKAYRQVLGR